MYDVVIIGGGVIGSAVGYFLVSDPGFDGRVVIVERDTTCASGSTARSVGGIRQQYSTPVNIRISKFAVEFLSEAGDRLPPLDPARPVRVFDAGRRKRLIGPPVQCCYPTCCIRFHDVVDSG